MQWRSVAAAVLVLIGIALFGIGALAAGGDVPQTPRGVHRVPPAALAGGLALSAAAGLFVLGQHRIGRGPSGHGRR